MGGLRRWCFAVRGLTVPLGRLDVLQKRWVALNDTDHLSPAAALAPSHGRGVVRVSHGVGGRAGVRGRSALLTDQLSEYHGSVLPKGVVPALSPRLTLDELRPVGTSRPGSLRSLLCEPPRNDMVATRNEALSILTPGARRSRGRRHRSRAGAARPRRGQRQIRRAAEGAMSSVAQLAALRRGYAVAGTTT